jgi:hypothetical protein
MTSSWGGTSAVAGLLFKKKQKQEINCKQVAGAEAVLFRDSILAHRQQRVFFASSEPAIGCCSPHASHLQPLRVLIANAVDAADDEDTASAAAAPQALDTGINRAWERQNQGKLFKHMTIPPAEE